VQLSTPGTPHPGASAVVSVACRRRLIYVVLIKNRVYHFSYFFSRFVFVPVRQKRFRHLRFFFLSVHAIAIDIAHVSYTVSHTVKRTVLWGSMDYRSENRPGGSTRRRSRLSENIRTRTRKRRRREKSECLVKVKLSKATSFTVERGIEDVSAAHHLFVVGRAVKNVTCKLIFNVKIRV